MLDQRPLTVLELTYEKHTFQLEVLDLVCFTSLDQYIDVYRSPLPLFVHFASLK